MGNATEIQVDYIQTTTTKMGSSNADAEMTPTAKPARAVYPSGSNVHMVQHTMIMRRPVSRKDIQNTNVLSSNLNVIRTHHELDIISSHKPCDYLNDLQLKEWQLKE